ncbi:MAG: hypothetical protein Q7S61_06015 [bacterium]|nr:hypothetical protein [bacterium]
MIIFASLIIVILFIAIIIFSFPQFSPIPYFPSNGKDIPMIIEGLNLTNNQTIVDLGAGDGVVILKAAIEAKEKKLNTQFIALELNPILILILHLRRFLHPNRKNIKINWGDMFKIDYQRLTFDVPRLTFYLYISPWFIEKVVQKIRKEVPSARFVSYYYPIKSLKHKEKKVTGVHSLYSYKIS